MQPTESSFTVKRMLTVFGFVILSFIIWQYVDNPMVVTVTGSGQVSAPANSATVSFTISASDPAVNGAILGVKAKADQMTQFLKTQGIPEGNIAESQVTAVPASLVSAGATGYQATISMAAKTTHVSEVSSLISLLYTQGVLVVAQPVLSVDNETNLDQQAFNSAMADANSQAGAIASKNWKLIKKIINVSQVSSPNTSTATTKADAITSANSAAAATNGVFKIVEAVSVSYKMW